MLVYVSGPYSSHGDVDQNIAEAMKIASELWNKGHAVICPHGNTGHMDDVFKSTANWDDYIKGDLHMICYCDAMVMMPLWKESRGAIVEEEYAQKLGIPVYLYPHLPELHPTEIRCPNQVQAFREELGKMYRLHLAKNSDYSPLNILMTGELGVIVRLWDKIARLLNLYGFRAEITKPGVFDKAREPKFEAITDSFQDAAVYSIIGQLVRQGKWGN